MVKIIISEDDEVKKNRLVSFIQSQGISESNIVIAKTLAEFGQKLQPDVNVCVIDVRIPAFEGANPDQNGQAILQMLDKEANSDVRLLAISAYPEEFSNLRAVFESRGCILADYHQTEVWQNALRTLIIQSAAQKKVDFLIFTALRKERAPYLTVPHLNPKAVSRDGISRLDVEIGGKSGSIIELPDMGLVDAAAMVAKCLERFSPKIVAMSGICAGFEGRAELGQLLISERAYEYQSGKWTNDGFKPGPYQIPISERLRLIARNLIEDADLIPRLETGWRFARPSTVPDPKMAVFTSGSAVIAAETYLEQVAEHHRKVSGLDMEVYAVHRAAHLARSTPDVLCAKVVVDMGNSGKDDSIQDYGCFVSSKFVIKVLEEYFSDA